MSLEERIASLERTIEILLEGGSCQVGPPGPRGRDGIDGVDGKNGLNGAKGADGKTPIKGVDYVDGTNGLNGKDGKDGTNGTSQASFTSYVFLRVASGITPARPTGGSYTNPTPVTGGWTDGAPSGQGPLFMSKRVFTDDGKPPQQEQWSNPALAASSTTVHFEWSSVTSPGNPTDNPENWVTNPNNDSIWMAIQTLDNGVWSEWTIAKIKGEDGQKGDKGDNGNSSIYMFAKNGSFSVAPALPPTEKNKRYPAGWSDVPPSFTDVEYLWKIVTVVDSKNDLVTNWSEPFRDTGRVGQNGANGAKGDKGAFLAPKGEFSDTAQYVGTANRLEAVLYTDGKWYVTRSDAGNIPVGTLPTNTAYWNVSDENFDFIATGLFLADIAYIKNLGVENLKTGTSGTRIEIIKAENRLKFFNGAETTPTLEIGKAATGIPGQVISTPEGPKQLTYDTSGVVAGPNQYSVAGVGVYRSSTGYPHPAYDVHITVGGGGPEEDGKLNHYGVGTFIQQLPTANAPIKDLSGPRNNYYGVLTNSIYIRPLNNGNSAHEGVFVYEGDTASSSNKAPLKGFTGTIGTAKYIHGICVGTA